MFGEGEQKAVVGVVAAEDEVLDTEMRARGAVDRHEKVGTGLWQVCV